MLKKLYAALLAATVFVMMMTPTFAAEHDSAFPRYVNAFNDETSLDTLSGGASYYLYEEEIGVDGESGRLSIPAASEVNTGFDYDDILEVGKKYKFSFWIKKANEKAASMYPVFMFQGATAEVTSKGASAYEAGEIVTGKTPWTSGATTNATDEWTKGECILDLSDACATLGSSSKVKIQSYNVLHLRLRGTGAFYMDNISFEPLYDYTEVEKQEEPEGAYVPGTEILPDLRTITTRYSTTIGLGQSDANTLVDKGTDVVLDANGRGTVKYGGKNGDMAFLAVSASGDRYIRFQGHKEGYTFLEKLDNRKVYQVSVRMKAPEVILDETIADSKFHVTSDGAVKAKSATNGKIGGDMSLGIQRSAAEGRIPVWFTTDTELTTEWVDYVGYIYFDTEEEITWDAIPNMQVTVSGGAGIFYIDEFSIKPMAYDDGNVIANSDFSITNGNKAFLYDGEEYTVAKDETVGNYLTVNKEDSEKSMPEMLFSAESGTEKEITFYAKGAEEGTVTVKVGEEEIGTEALSLDWNKFTFSYTPQTGGTESLVISADVNFSLAKVKILEPIPPITDAFTAFDVTGNTAETHTLDISYTYPTEESASYFVRVSRGNKENGYLPVYEAETAMPQSVDYSVTAEDVGKHLLVEVLVIQSGEIKAVKYETEAVQPALSVIPAIKEWNPTDTKVEATVSVGNNRAGGDALELFAFLVITGENEKVFHIVESGAVTVESGSAETIELEAETLVINGEAPMQAKLYVWEGTSIYDTTMEAYTDEVVYTLQ